MSVGKDSILRAANADAKKTEVKAETKPAEEVKAPVKAEAAPAAKKAPAKKADPKACVYIEFAGKQIVAKDVLDKAVKAYAEAHKGAEIKTIEVYVKPEENVAYYVVNGEGSDDYKVTL